MGDAQRLSGKWFDPIWPVLGGLAPAAALDPADLRAVQRSNAEALEGARRGEVVCELPVLGAYGSGAMTFDPGDVILTGTPLCRGVFAAPASARPPRDRVEVEQVGAVVEAGSR